MLKNEASIFVTQKLPELIEERMNDLFNVQFNQHGKPLSEEELIKSAKNHTVLLSTITDPLNKNVIKQLPKTIKLIAQFGNGIDNIDIAAASKRSIVVTNTPSTMSEDTADMAMALMLSIPRRLVEGSQILTATKQFSGWSPNWMLGRRLKGKSLGIVGLGRIGLAVATRAKAFGLDIHYYSRTRRPSQIEEQLNANWSASLNQLIEKVDILSLHIPLTKQSEKIINSERLKLMKKGAFLINVSRSELIDENALVEMIEKNHLSGAGLDVFEHQNGINPKLLALAKDNKVLLTPHMASATLEGRIEMGETVLVNIKTFLDGHRPPHRILPEG
ncbi:MAG: D-glycerate dehydrogenase [Devosiaceae bacterium]|nr:D-glycerate dehydrogenase [Devosiaceae bacterium]